MRVLALSLVFGLMIWLLSGCTGLAQLDDSSPLQRDREAFVLPAAAELTAVVTLSASDAAEEYLLALHSRHDSFQGAILTPAGITVASLDFSPIKQDISTVLDIGELLSPSQLVAYLELMYLPVATLRSVLSNDWCLEEGPATRHFFRDCSGDAPLLAFSIRYSGDAPWYATIALQDQLRHRVLTLKVLEVNNVLSE